MGDDKDLKCKFLFIGNCNIWDMFLMQFISHQGIRFCDSIEYLYVFLFTTVAFHIFFSQAVKIQLI